MLQQIHRVTLLLHRHLQHYYYQQQQQQQQQQKQILVNRLLIYNNNNKAVRKFRRIIMTEKPKVVFVLGGPGAGKGTQCSKIVERFHFEHLSAGDLLREERLREGSKYGALIEDHMRNGKIVPVAVTCSLLENAINKSANKLFLVDGFPRNQDNLDGWNKQMADKVDFQFVLFFDCPEDVCVNRCLNRGSGGSGRPDDNYESLKKRIQTHKTDSVPIVEYFAAVGKVKQIDASCNVDDIFKKVEDVFREAGFK